MRRTDGNITTDGKEILDVCAEFYKDLYSSKKEGGKKASIKSIDDTEIPSTILSEIEMALTQMKHNKHQAMMIYQVKSSK